MHPIYMCIETQLMVITTKAMIIVLDDENNGKELGNDIFSVFVNFVFNVIYLLKVYII